jgi:hypothetical protein
VLVSLVTQELCVAENVFTVDFYKCMLINPCCYILEEWFLKQSRAVRRRNNAALWRSHVQNSARSHWLRSLDNARVYCPLLARVLACLHMSASSLRAANFSLWNNSAPRTIVSSYPSICLLKHDVSFSITIWRKFVIIHFCSEHIWFLTVLEENT